MSERQSEPVRGSDELDAVYNRPEPYYQDDFATIYHGDCREILPALTFDSILTDAPYGVGLSYDVHDDTVEALDGIVDALTPVLLNGGTHGVFPGVGNLHRWPQPTWTLCWMEPAGTRTGKWGFSTWQPVLAYGPDPYLATGRGRQPDSLRTTGTSATNLREREGNTAHPCPKPLTVMRWAIERITRPDAVVLDPFMGSGSTLVAAKSHGRVSIGVDVSEAYCEMAAKRLAQEVLDFGGVA